MPDVTSQADIALDWRGLLEAVVRNPEVLLIVEMERNSLAVTLGELEVLKARQEELTALRHETTQMLNATVARGRDLAIQIRSLARGKLGPRSERLIHFRVAPIRSRTRKLPDLKKSLVKLPGGEASGIEPGASVSPSTEPVA
jgi:hypothetical protein